MDFVDSGDFCRTCRGKGYVTFKEGGRSITENCEACRGTGYRTVRVSAPCHSSAHAPHHPPQRPRVGTPGEDSTTVLPGTSSRSA